MSNKLKIRVVLLSYTVLYAVKKTEDPLREEL